MNDDQSEKSSTSSKRQKSLQKHIKNLRLTNVQTAIDGSGHSIGITEHGKAYTWGRNSLGQLGIGTSSSKINVPQPIHLSTTPTNGPTDAPSSSSSNGNISAIRGFVGGFSDAGHSAILDSKGYLWLTGCDRWQQLGLGSASGGSSGYTWKDGKLWQESFIRNDFLMEFIRKRNQQIGWTVKSNSINKNSGGHGTNDDKKNNDSTCLIRDVAIGGDHTVILSSNQHDVITFGKGAEGQLGLINKPFVNALAVSKELSTTPQHPSNDSIGTTDASQKIAAVCAIGHCSLTLGDNNEVMNMVGKCRRSSMEFQKALKTCQLRVHQSNLVEKR